MKYLFSFRDKYPDNILDYKVAHYDTFFEKTQSQTYETIGAGYTSEPWSSVLLNKKVISEQASEFAHTINELWIPRCIYNNSAACNTLYQFHLTLPRNDDNIEGTVIKVKYKVRQ